MDPQTHSSYGKTIDSLNTLVIGAQRSSMLLTRSMLGMTGVKSVTGFENMMQALNHLISYEINLVMIDAECKPISGLKFVKVLRHSTTSPLCFIPVILTCSEPTPNYINLAMKMGAQHVLNRPFSTSMLRDRLLWILNDKRQMHLKDNRWAIEGVDDRLLNSAQNKLLPSLLSQMGLASSKTANEATAAQALVDNILDDAVEKRKAGQA
jgi:two-component system chemotaxis response regulator CheY